MHIKSLLIQTRTVSRPSKFKTKWVGYVHRAPKRCPLQSNNKLSFNNSNSSKCRSTWWINSICKALLWASGSTLAWCNNNSSKWTMPSNSKCLRISKCSIHNKWVVLVNSSCLASHPSADRVQPGERLSSISVRSLGCQVLRMSLWGKFRARRMPRPPARSTLRSISCVLEWSIKSANVSTTMSWSRGWLQTIWRTRILVFEPNFKLLKSSCKGRIKLSMTWSYSKRLIMDYHSRRQNSRVTASEAPSKLTLTWLLIWRERSRRLRTRTSADLTK